MSELIRKTDIVRADIRQGFWKEALRIAKDFRLGVTQEQRDTMCRAYECIVHPEFYKQIGVDTQEAIRQGKLVLLKLYS